MKITFFLLGFQIEWQLEGLLFWKDIQHEQSHFHIGITDVYVCHHNIALYPDSPPHTHTIDDLCTHFSFMCTKVMNHFTHTRESPGTRLIMIKITLCFELVPTDGMQVILYCILIVPIHTKWLQQLTATLLATPWNLLYAPSYIQL